MKIVVRRYIKGVGFVPEDEKTFGTMEEFTTWLETLTPERKAEVAMRVV